MINAYLRGRRDSSQPKSLGPILFPFGAHGPVMFRTTARRLVRVKGVKNSLSRPHAPSSSQRAWAREKFFHEAKRA